jgi:hypothetical protein
MILMKEEIKKRWVQALCSGKYKRGEGSLYNFDTGAHCALGVLCELAVEDGVTERRDSPHGGPSFYGKDRNGSDSILPREVMEWAGVDSPSPTVSYADESNGETNFWTVSEMNDMGASFEYIAEKIESEE